MTRKIVGNNLVINGNERGIGNGSGLPVWGASEVAKVHAATGVAADVVAEGMVAFQMGETVVDEMVLQIAEAGGERTTVPPEVAVLHPRVLILALLLQRLRSIAEVADTMIAPHQEEEDQKVLPDDVKMRVLHDGVTMRAHHDGVKMRAHHDGVTMRVLPDDVTMRARHDDLMMKALPHGIVVVEEAPVVEEMTTGEAEMASLMGEGVDTPACFPNHPVRKCCLRTTGKMLEQMTVENAKYSLTGCVKT